MGYTKYCEGYRKYTVVNNLTNHLDNKPGVKKEVDWSGPTMSYCDTSTGEIVTVYAYTTTWVETGKSNMREYCAKLSN